MYNNIEFEVLFIQLHSHSITFLLNYKYITAQLKRLATSEIISKCDVVISPLGNTGFIFISKTTCCSKTQLGQFN